MKIAPIKLRKAMSGIRGNYSEAEFQTILDGMGKLPTTKVLYRGGYVAFHILGDDYPGLADKYAAYMYDAPLNKRKMVRATALRCHLEAAAYDFKEIRRQSKLPPSQRREHLLRLEEACRVLLDGIPFDTAPRHLEKTLRQRALWGDSTAILLELLSTIAEQQEILSHQHTPFNQRHKKDSALFALVASLCDAWEYIAERQVLPGSPTKSGGPLNRFIQASLLPLGIKRTPNAIREMLKDVVKSKSLKS